VSFATTWGPAVWVVFGEMFPVYLLPWCQYVHCIQLVGLFLFFPSLTDCVQRFFNCIIGVIMPYFVAADKLNLGNTILDPDIRDWKSHAVV
jgi:hypothetical protein